MIVPMKKVSLVVMEGSRDISLEKLREVGVIHLERKSVSSDTLGALLEKRARIGRTMGILRRYPVKKNAPGDSFFSKDVDLVTKVLGLSDEKKTLQDELVYFAREIRRIEPWGDFEPSSFSFLEKNGVKLIPYEFTLKEYDALEKSADKAVEHFIISRDKRGVRVLSVGAIEGFTPFVFNPRSLSRIDERVDNIYQRVDEIEKELAGLAKQLKSLEAENKKLTGEIEFETARAGMETREDAEVVTWISGFVPADRLGVLKRSAADYGWALVWEDPVHEDKPPTLVRNPAAVRIIQPLFSFLGTVPGYQEYDISLSYLVFFCLFFAMIFGDASYGLLLLLISLASAVVFKKKSGKVPDASKLFILLSLCTVAWGSITGSWFAIPTEKLPLFLQSLIIPPFNNSGPLAQFPQFMQKVFNLPAEVPVDSLKTRWNIQFLCFSVGAVQLVWARAKNIVKSLPSLTALAQAGWLTMMIGLYFLVLFMLLKIVLPPFTIYMIVIGIALYFIFAQQEGGNFFINILKSFANFLPTFLNAVGSFADIISYIRLFAVGLAGSSIAQSFNSMAIPAEGFGAFGVQFVLRLLAAVLILILGHALNIVMNALSVIVHGVRLNLLEYAANHLGMEWSGYEYKPFANKQKI